MFKKIITAATIGATMTTTIFLVLAIANADTFNSSIIEELIFNLDLMLGGIIGFSTLGGFIGFLYYMFSKK